MTQEERPLIFYEMAQRRLEVLERQRRSIEKQMLKSPEGMIHIVNSRGRTQYYLRTESNDKSGVYIPKRNSKVIGALLQKKYDLQFLKLINMEMENLKKFLEKSIVEGRFIVEKQGEIFSAYPEEIKKLVNRFEISDDEYVHNWLSEEYERKLIGEDVPFYETDKGERVRSKSELTIANTLLKRGIPYKYECPLLLRNGWVVYPDFTTLNVRERKTLYWEHRGMMDDFEYSRNAVQKNKVYMRDGIVVGRNLIITEETSNHPLGTDEINIIISQLLM